MATQMSDLDYTDSIFTKLRTRGWNRSTCGAVFGLVGGIVAPIVGSVFTVVGWISGPSWHGFAIQRTGTVLLFLTIPLLLFGAHCLDLSDRKDGNEITFPSRSQMDRRTEENDSDRERD